MNLLPKIAQGDIHALELLYEQYKTRVYRLALSLTADPYLAEDITQETFLRIQEQSPSYRKQISEAAWIITIARNLSYDHLRRRSREVPQDLTQNESSLSLPDESSEHSFSGLYFLELIKGLSREEKEVICLRILAGLPWKETGQITGQSADACRKRYERALKKLQRQLNAGEPAGRS